MLADAKRSASPASLASGLAPPVAEALTALLTSARELRFDEEPPYEELIALLRDAGGPSDAPFEWDGIVAWGIDGVLEHV